ncbi:MAG: type III-B CRISPR module RAMP protein Cmr4 [Verrucomicrobiae bacterium]|nr:type III-B CRISPR module RAMP protein Cmr4 [Verrucomicrobiae bacterium]
MKPDRRLFYIFTRTPLHIGAGASVGAIDQPIVRERHTGFPIIPAASLKGTFSDCWNERRKTKTTKNGHEIETEVIERSEEGRWLFGEADAANAAAGALQFTEARLLAFPVRSARGSFAWITCPLILARAMRDGVFNDHTAKIIGELKEPPDEHAIFTAGKIDLELRQGNTPLKQVVLEEYTFTKTGAEEAHEIGKALAALADDDPVWAETSQRLVILSNGMMSFFTRNACEVAQHVRINDETNTAARGALFNQENVPSETMFYAIVHAFHGRGRFQTKTPVEALQAFAEKLHAQQHLFQFGADASTGLGYCTVKLAK